MRVLLISSRLAKVAIVVRDEREAPPRLIVFLDEVRVGLDKERVVDAVLIPVKGRVGLDRGGVLAGSQITCPLAAWSTRRTTMQLLRSSF